MASSIVPGNIAGTFPVAGQDNSSQGFRDNFTASKNNFTYAKSEIETLQTYRASLNANNSFGDNIITIPKIEVRSMATVGEWGEISERKISYDTAKKFNTKIKRNGNIITHHLYGYYNNKNKPEHTLLTEFISIRYLCQAYPQNSILTGMTASLEPLI